MDDVIIQKLASLDRCMSRVKEEFRPKDEFLTNYTKQDAAILNLLRACETCTDIANALIKERKLGLYENARGGFELLLDNGLLTKESTVAMKRMLGFRNIAVHEYQKMDIDIVISIIEKHLGDFEEFANHIKRAINAAR